MERLTYDFCVGSVHCNQVRGTDNLECGEVCQRQDDDGCATCPIARAFDRLAAIEGILGDEYDLDRLRELAQADWEGRCVVLPCKLHDKVFFIENGCVKETEVDSFHNWTSGRWKISTHTDRMYEHWKGYEIDFSGIGKTVFLSREDAEKAVEMEENRNG